MEILPRISKLSLLKGKSAFINGLVIVIAFCFRILQILPQVTNQFKFTIIVCTTELGEVARVYPAFRQRNVKVLALSCDTIESHHLWQKDIDETQKVTVGYPIIAGICGLQVD